MENQRKTLCVLRGSMVTRRSRPPGERSKSFARSAPIRLDSGPRTLRTASEYFRKKTRRKRSASACPPHSPPVSSNVQIIVSGFAQVIMGDRPAAERACKEPNPIIDGRKANVNLAILGAKPRGNLQPGEIDWTTTLFHDTRAFVFRRGSRSTVIPRPRCERTKTTRCVRRKVFKREPSSAEPPGHVKTFRRVTDIRPAGPHDVSASPISTQKAASTDEPGRYTFRSFFVCCFVDGSRPCKNKDLPADRSLCAVRNVITNNNNITFAFPFDRDGRECTGNNALVYDIMIIIFHLFETYGTRQKPAGTGGTPVTQTHGSSCWSTVRARASDVDREGYVSVEHPGVIDTRPTAPAARGPCQIGTEGTLTPGFIFVRNNIVRGGTFRCICRDNVLFSSIRRFTLNRISRAVVFFVFFFYGPDTTQYARFINLNNS